MVRLRDSWPFSLSSAPTVGNPCRPLQPESVSFSLQVFPGALPLIKPSGPRALNRTTQSRRVGCTVLVHHWGRIGTRGRERSDLHENEAAAAEAMAKLAAIKRRRGYQDLEGRAEGL